MIGRFPLNIVDTAYKAGFANPVGIAYDSGRGIIGVANYGSSEISFVDYVTFTVIATVNVPAGNNNAWSYITFDNAGDRYFAASERIEGYGDNLIYIINATTFSLSLAITDPSSTAIYRGIEFDYTNDRMFISCYKNPNSIPSEIKIYKYSDFSYITNFIANRASGIVFDAVSNKLYVAGHSSNNLRIYDGTSYALLTTIATGGLTYGVSQDPDNSDLLVIQNYGLNTLQLFRKSTNTIIGTYSGITTPRFSVFVGNKIYVTAATINSVSIIDKFY